MKKTLITLLIIVGLLMVGVFVAPSLVDWNTYKGEVAQRLGVIVGRTVEIQGDIKLSLLPRPALSVHDARLANTPGAAEPYMMRLKELDMSVALWPLLERKLTVESVTLVEPVLAIETLPDGRFNWDLFAIRNGAPDARNRSGDGFANAVRFDDVQIRRGTILYRDASGRSERAENVEARVVANSLSGPFQLQGSFAWRGAPLRGELIFGPLVEGMAVPLRGTITMANGDATLRLAGTVGSLLSLNVRAEGNDLARVAKALHADDGIAPPVLEQPFSVRSVIEAVPDGGYSFTGLEAQLGNTRAAGGAALRLKPTPDGGATPDVGLTLAVNRLDLDAWKPLVTLLTQTPASPKPVTPQKNAPGAAGAVESPESKRSLGFSGRLDLSVEEIAVNAGQIRQARVEAVLADDTLTINRASAQLPGGSDIAAAGVLNIVDGLPDVGLRLDMNADNARDLLDWLKIDVSGAPAAPLGKASFTAQVHGRPGKIDVTGIDLRLNASQVTGAIAYVGRDRPAFGVRLAVDRLVLDPYLPALLPPSATGSLTTAKGGASGGSGKEAGSDGLGVLDRLLRTVDANLDLTIGQLIVQGVPVQALHVDATANAGILSVHNATLGDAAGVSARLSGQIGGLTPLRITHLTVATEADSLAGLAKSAAWPSSAPTPERLGRVEVRGRVAGDLERLSVELNIAAAGGVLEAGGVITGLPHRATADLKLRAIHSTFGRLTGLLEDSSGIDLYAEAKGTAKKMTLSNIQGLIAGTAVRGDGQIDLTHSRPRIQADIQTGGIDLDRLLVAPPSSPPPSAGEGETVNMTADDTLNVGWLRGFDGRFGLTSAAMLVKGARIEHPALRATVEDGVLTLEQLDGVVLGGQIGVTGRLEAPAQAPARVEMNVTLVKALLTEAFVSGTLDLDLEMSAAGVSRRAMMQALSGKGTLHVRNGIVRGFDLGELRDRLTRLDRPQDTVKAMLGALHAGETRFTRLDGAFVITDGVVSSDDLRLISEPGEATAVGRVNLPERSIDMLVGVTVKAEDPPPAIGVRVVGPFDTPTRSIDMRAVQEFIAKRAASGVTEKTTPAAEPRRE